VRLLGPRLIPPSNSPPETLSNLTESSDTNDATLTALGRVVQAASMLDQELRTAFCALMGTKYAAVVAGGQSTGWLVETCEALTKVHQRLSDEHRRKLLALLTDCRQASERRNRLVHDVWAGGPEGPALVRSRKHRHDLEIQPETLAETEALARTLNGTSVRLEALLTDALGPDAIVLEVQLRWEDYVRGLSPEELAERLSRRRESTAE